MTATSGLAIAILAAAATVAGVLIGGLLNYFTEQARINRERDFRMLEVRRLLYIKYLQVTARIVGTFLQVISKQDFIEKRADLLVLQNEGTDVLSELAFMAPDDVFDPARAVNDSVQTMVRYVTAYYAAGSQVPVGSDSEAARLLMGFTVAREPFAAAAQRDVGMTLRSTQAASIQSMMGASES
jgi:hypothetical protein